MTVCIFARPAWVHCSIADGAESCSSISGYQSSLASVCAVTLAIDSNRYATNAFYRRVSNAGRSLRCLGRVRDTPQRSSYLPARTSRMYLLWFSRALLLPSGPRPLNRCKKAKQRATAAVEPILVLLTKYQFFSLSLLSFAQGQQHIYKLYNKAPKTVYDGKTIH